MSALIDPPVERLLTTLLYEGYALYPYTPGATKNATPTPFGIVYPPVYAAGSPHTFERARMQLVLEAASPSAPVGGTVAFLEHSGERHQGVERRVALGPLALDELIAADGLTAEFAFDQVSGACAWRLPRSTAGWCDWRSACTTRRRWPTAWTGPTRCAARCSQRTL